MSDPLARGVIWSSLWNSVRDAQLSVFRYLDMVERFAPAETDLAILSSILTDAQYAVLHYVPKKLAAQWVQAGWNDLEGGVRSRTGVRRQLVWARALSAVAAVNDVAPTRCGRYSTAPARGRSDWLSILICGGHCGSPLSATGHVSVSDFDGELTRTARQRVERRTSARRGVDS